VSPERQTHYAPDTQLEGSMKPHQVPVPDHVLDQLHNTMCVTCGGVGEVYWNPFGQWGSVEDDRHYVCPHCDGTGYEGDPMEVTYD
jgi:hypothetical protein